MRSLPGTERLPSIQHAVDADAAFTGLLLGVLQGLQRLHRGRDNVDAVCRAIFLGQDIVYSGRLHDVAYRLTGDDAGAGTGRLEHHFGGVEAALDGMGNGRPAQGDADELLLGILDALADGLGHLAGLTEPGAHDAVP